MFIFFVTAKSIARVSPAHYIINGECYIHHISGRDILVFTVLSSTPVNYVTFNYSSVIPMKEQTGLCLQHHIKYDTEPKHLINPK